MSAPALPSSPSGKTPSTPGIKTVSSPSPTTPGGKPLSSSEQQTLQGLAQLFETLQQAGVSQADIVSTFKSLGQNQTSTPSAVIRVPFRQYSGLDKSYKFHGHDCPRVGGIDENGIWTGRGKAAKGLIIKDYNCYRKLDLGNKSLSEQSKIKAYCKKGLEDKPEYRFVLSTEKTETKLNDTLRQMETFMINHGLEGCFDIVTKSERINVFRQFGRVSDTMAQQWIDDVLINGVLASSTGRDHRYNICPYDADAMEISGEAILNSCSASLKRTIMRELADEERNGVSVFLAAIRLGRTYKNANVRSMCNDLESMDLRKYPGENVLAFCQDAMDRVDEIRLAAQTSNDLENLTQLVVHGMSLGSDEGLRSEVRLIIKDASAPDSSMTPEMAVKELSGYYTDSLARKTYGPAEQAPPQAFQAYVQQAINQVTDRLTQDRSGVKDGNNRNNDSSRGGPGRGNGAGRRHTSVSMGDAGDRDKNKKINDLVRLSIKASGLPKDDTVDHDLKDDTGTIVAKYCGKCSKWTKGNKLHYTRECTRTESVPPESASDSLPDNPESNLASGDSTSDITPSSGTLSTPPPSSLRPTGMLSLRGLDYSLPASPAPTVSFSQHLKGSGGRGY